MTTTGVVTATRHVLPFERLDADSFERLCLWLLRARGYENLQHLGAAGAENGRDIVGARDGAAGTERIYVQCKRARGAVRAATLIAEVRTISKAVADSVAPRPDVVIFAITHEPSATVRAKVEAECAVSGYGCEWLTLHLLDIEVKGQAGILEEFFGGGHDAGAGALPVNSLRAPPANFVDRDQERAELDRLRVQAVAARRSAVALLCGMGGVGKSTLARDWAHVSREDFPGGRLHVDLGDWRRSGLVDMVGVVSQLLADLGMRPALQPAAFEQKVREYRRIVDRRCLVLVVDDAHYASEVLPLVPDSTGSVTLVTSREWIHGLIAEGATAVETRPLGDAESARLFVAVAGEGARDADGGVVADLVRACGGLPLALTACGAQLAGRRSEAAPRLLRRLGRAADDLGEGPLPLQVFDASYEALGPELRVAYRRLLGGPLSFLSPFAASAVLGGEADDAERVCEILASLSLLEEYDGGWRGHALVRQHARAISRDVHVATDDERALLALARRFAWAASRADGAIVEDRPRLGVRARVSEPAVADRFATLAEAHDWWMRERTNVAAVALLCDERGWDEELMLLAEGSWPMAVALRTVPEWETVQGLASAAAVRRGDSLAEARFRSQQARALADGGEHVRAAEACALALEAARAAGDEQMLASVTEFAGVCLLEAGDAAGALEALDRARPVFARLGVARGVALQDYYASRALLRLGRPEEALTRIAAAFDPLVMSRDEVSVARAHLRRGEAHLALGRVPEAAEAAESARATASKNGHDIETAQAFDLLATCADEQDDATTAATYREAARELYRVIGHPSGVS